MLCAGRRTAATNGDGQSKQEAEGGQEMRLWVCMTHEIMVLAGHTRGGRCSKQMKAGKRAQAQRGAMNRKRALEGDGTTRMAVFWAGERRKWRRVRACSTAGGLRRGNAWRQGCRGQIQAGKRARALAGR